MFVTGQRLMVDEKRASLSLTPYKHMLVNVGSQIISLSNRETISSFIIKKKYIDFEQILYITSVTFKLEGAFI